ncbi:hypothetical protein ACVBEG_27560 [Pseudomonas sp. GG8]
MVDPPSFQKGSFVLHQDYQKSSAACLIRSTGKVSGPAHQ